MSSLPHLPVSALLEEELKKNNIYSGVWFFWEVDKQDGGDARQAPRREGWHCKRQNSLFHPTAAAEQLLSLQKPAVPCIASFPYPAEAGDITAVPT